MPTRIASYNVENLFSRSAAFLDFAGKKADGAILAAYTQLTELLAKPSYEGHQEEILALLNKLDLIEEDESKIAVLRLERGSLLERDRKKAPWRWPRPAGQTGSAGSS